MERATRLGLAALLLLACTACNPTVLGNGVFAERTFDVAAFDRLEVGYAFTVNVDVISGPSPRLVRISGDENIVNQYISVEVVDSTLRIENSEEFIRAQPISIHIDAPELVAVTVREGTQVTVTGARAASFALQATEGSRVTISGDPGAAGALSATLDTGSVLDARAFPVSTAAVSLASHSEARLTCGGPVTGSASGGSTVTVQGGGTCELTLSGAPAASSCSAVP